MFRKTSLCRHSRGAPRTRAAQLRVQAQGVQGGHDCRLAQAQAEGALIEELAEDFIGPIQHHILWRCEPPPNRCKNFAEQLDEGLDLSEMQHRQVQQTLATLEEAKEKVEEVENS